MADPHRHAGDHAGHQHSIGADAQPKWLVVALLINLGFMVAEVAVGLIANSVALISDAAHMLSDAGAIGLALFAVRLAQRPPSGRFTFGFKRSEILSAQLNGASLLVLAAVIGYASIGRIGSPPEVDGPFVIAVGLVGAGANGAAAWALARANRSSLNVEGAFLHNLYDLFSSLAAALAGVAIVVWGFNAADPIAALLVCVLMLRAGWSLLRDSGRIRMEGTPREWTPARSGAPSPSTPASSKSTTSTCGRSRRDSPRSPPRARRTRRRLPRAPARARAPARRPLRDRTHHAAGRPSGRSAPLAHRAFG